jgi:hypothetical protein
VVVVVVRIRGSRESVMWWEHSYNYLQKETYWWNDVFRGKGGDKGLGSGIPVGLAKLPQFWWRVAYDQRGCDG